MYWKNKIIFIGLIVLLLNGCASSQHEFFGFAPGKDRKDYLRAREAYNAGNYQQAIEELSAYIYKTKNVQRREARAYRLLGQSYEQLGQLNRALELYLEALEFHPKSVPLLVAAANLYQRTGLLERSQQLYERALEQEPNHPEALSGLAHNYYLIGFDSKAREIYDRFFSLDTNNPLPLHTARYAQTFLRQRNYEQAFIHIANALTEENTNPDFWLLSARALHGLNRMEDALANLEAALLLSPNDKSLLATKALWLYQDRRYAQARQTAQQILKKEPNNQLAFLIQALTFYKQGKHQKARQLLRQTAQLDANSFTGKVAEGILTEL